MLGIDSGDPLARWTSFLVNLSLWTVLLVSAVAATLVASRTLRARTSLVYVIVAKSGWSLHWANIVFQIGSECGQNV